MYSVFAHLTVMLVCNNYLPDTVPATCSQPCARQPPAVCVCVCLCICKCIRVCRCRCIMTASERYYKHTHAHTRTHICILYMHI